MSHRHRVEDEVQPVHALRAAAEASEGDVPTAAILDAPGRAQEPGRGGVPAVARAIGGLQASAGNGAVAWMLQGSARSSQRERPPQVHAAHAAIVDRPVVQREPGDEEATPGVEATEAATDGDTGMAAVAGNEPATELGGGAPPANPSWTKVGPPSNTTYAVSGSLRTVATAIAAKPEAGSVTVTPSRTLQSWTPDGGTQEVISAQVTVKQVVELPTWTDKSSATKNQQAEWDRFHAAITTHEAGHVGKDKTAFANVHSNMLKKTESDADGVLDAAEAQAKTDNAAYDTSTQSGISQGTGINANIDEVTKVP